MSETHDYLEDRADADELIAEFGQSGVLRRQTTSGPAHNPVVTTTDYDATFAVLDYTNREVDGTRVFSTDKKVLLKAGALAVTPTLSDELVIGGVAHSLIRIDPLAPGGTVVCWTLQIRR